MRLLWRELFVIVLGLGLASVAASQEAFRVELGKDGETIGDMRPVFLQFKNQPMPAISPVEVARRYQKLFDSTEEPSVRLDALARLSNLQRLTDEDIGLSPSEEQRVYREALDSFAAVLNQGNYQGRLDELLYQMAKANAYIGQVDESVSRLKQLIGLYPSSELVPEARFRVAEVAFSAGRYSEAEAEYQRFLSSSSDDNLKTRARYMMGWSQYKQGSVAWDRAASSFLTVLTEQSQQSDNFQRIAPTEAGLIEDTLRIMAMMAASGNGYSDLAGWLASAGGVTYDYLLFDRLADLYAARGDYENSVEVGARFADEHPRHPSVPGFLAQRVNVWRLSGDLQKVRDAQGDYADAFMDAEAYERLGTSDRDVWAEFAQTLADVHYQRATQTNQNNEFLKAARYYEALARRSVEPGEFYRLAGDAWLQSQEHHKALTAFRHAAYDSGIYPDAANAGWAAMTLEREGLDGFNGLSVTLADVVASAKRWAQQFPQDHRNPGLKSDLANRLLADGQHDLAKGFAESAIAHSAVTDSQAYASWLVLGEVLTSNAAHNLAENAWKKAFELVGTGAPVESVTEHRIQLKNQIANSIYWQAEQAAAAGQAELAVAHFQRIGSVDPGSEIAVKAQFDAANTLLKAGLWQTAISELTRFQREFPEHELSTSIDEKLVYAYENSEQPELAADVLMATADLSEQGWETRLRAAELYEKATALDKRNDIYATYLEHHGRSSRSSKEHVRKQTFRQRLLEARIDVSEQRLALVESELESQWHTDDTLTWSARAAVALGAIKASQFSAVELTNPLPRSLATKKAYMDEALERFSQAEQLGGDRLLSQVLYRKAEIYRAMAKDLMASEPPSELNELEAMQYQMLLEEEAFPFEEKAIAIHASNHQQVAQGRFDEWVAQSLRILAELFPGRYDRTVRWMGFNAIPEGGNS